MSDSNFSTIKTYTCEEHNKSYVIRWRYEKHMAQFHASTPESDGRFECEHEQCIPRKRYKTQTGINKHNWYHDQQRLLEGKGHYVLGKDGCCAWVRAGHHHKANFVCKGDFVPSTTPEDVQQLFGRGAPTLVGMLTNTQPGEYKVVVLLADEYHALKAKADTYDSMKFAFDNANPER